MIIADHWMNMACPEIPRAFPIPQSLLQEWRILGIRKNNKMKGEYIYEHSYPATSQWSTEPYVCGYSLHRQLGAGVFTEEWLLSIHSMLAMSSWLSLWQESL